MTLLSHIFNAACGPLLAVLGASIFLNAWRNRTQENVNSRFRSLTLGSFISLTSFVAVALCTKLLLRVINTSTDSSIQAFEWTLIVVSVTAWVLGFLYFPRYFKTRRAVRRLIFATVAVAMMALILRDHALGAGDVFLIIAMAVWIVVMIGAERKRTLARGGETRSLNQ
ncbi:hypothetical protein H5P28_13395 [Ruficoccus amylovorans]|uniref:Uncharacterized protein n=1 Tax=Ruficoccus amylovorans TaxID=1804625 RepID=A0A842HIA7_9BACT|nr:hypothetical protein [Ruficoccus amylovorans]MBC2595257.1 hypothetical protein [Ruficoccus amylovorans]